jgi:hypothetical protein
MDIFYLLNLDKSCSEIHVTFENVESVNIRLYQIRFGHKISPQLNAPYSTDKNTIIIKHDINKDNKLIVHVLSLIVMLQVQRILFIK